MNVQDFSSKTGFSYLAASDHGSKKEMTLSDMIYRFYFSSMHPIQKCEQELKVNARMAPSRDFSSCGERPNAKAREMLRTRKEQW